jgi:hypothetical protein
MWLTWVEMVLATFAQPKVARLPGRTPAKNLYFMQKVGYIPHRKNSLLLKKEGTIPLNGRTTGGTPYGLSTIPYS